MLLGSPIKDFGDDIFVDFGNDSFSVGFPINEFKDDGECSGFLIEEFWDDSRPCHLEGA
jgi:hypothetical protein